MSAVCRKGGGVVGCQLRLEHRACTASYSPQCSGADGAAVYTRAWCTRAVCCWCGSWSRPVLPPPRPGPVLYCHASLTGASCILLQYILQHADALGCPRILARASGYTCKLLHLDRRNVCNCVRVFLTCCGYSRLASTKYSRTRVAQYDNGV